jgi:hypothetical protein
MAYNTREGVRDKVIEYLDGRTDLNTKINSWIDDARRDIANKYNFAYLYVEATCDTSAGSARYALPSDYLNHLNLFIETKKLVRIDPTEFDAVHGDDIALDSTTAKTPYLYTTGALEQGEPEYYIDRGLEFDLWPTPDGTYTLTMRYYAQPSAFTDDDDYDYITTFHTEAVIFGAAYRGAVYLEDKDKMAIYRDQYTTQINTLLQREKERKGADIGHRMKSWKDFNINQFKRLMKVNNF